ncbi:MAG: AAA family ATPase [Deltaproteobacteria bacterium]|nr:AAA family ATPase [Deltaproteobacteria bacterium]
MNRIFPFPALVGQDLLKLGLILTIINPSLGGVLIRGEKGTAKSTAVRGLAELLPQLKVVSGCRFSCHPDHKERLCSECQARLRQGSHLISEERRTRVVELPIGATEDRVLGTLDLEGAITEGTKRFEPGILAQANRGILYVDEVNLLDDHLVDVLLDAAAMGVNIVEREGISFSHPALFTLVGTMNPEEGELRPQLLDRFGLCVKVEGLSDPALRREIIVRRLAFDADPEEFTNNWRTQGQELAGRIVTARNLFREVQISEASLRRAVEICLALGVDGHRGDLTVVKTAMALAAFNGRTTVEIGDIEQAAELALPHRVRRRPFQEVEFGVLEKMEKSSTK